jgi:di/tripeptidase
MSKRLFENFHHKFSAARTNFQKENVRKEHDAFIATLSVEERTEYLEGLTNYGRKIMKAVEAELHTLNL